MILYLKDCHAMKMPELRYLEKECGALRFTPISVSGEVAWVYATLPGDFQFTLALNERRRSKLAGRTFIKPGWYTPWVTASSAFDLLRRLERHRLQALAEERSQQFRWS